MSASEAIHDLRGLFINDVDRERRSWAAIRLFIVEREVERLTEENEKLRSREPRES